jgi:pentatricopeptide repeat protein
LNANVHPQLVAAWYGLFRKKLEFGRVSEALRVWHDMREEGILPNIALYHSALSHFKRTNHVRIFFMFFEEMRNSGLVPDVLMYNMAIHLAAKGAQVEKAFDMSKEMDRLDLTKEAMTYGSLLYACSRVKDFDRALSVVADMVKAGHSPNDHIFTELVNSCASKAHLEQVAGVLGHVEKQYAGQLTMLASYNCFMGKCLEMGATEMGMDWFKKMTDGKMTPDSRTYFSLIRGCVCSSEPKYDLAMRLFGDMKARRIAAEPGVYEFLLQQAQEPQRLEASFAVLEDMLAQGFKPPPPVWALLFSAACVKERPELVRFVWDKMQEEKVPLGLHTLRQYKQFCKRHMPERKEEARELMLQWRPPQERQQQARAAHDAHDFHDYDTHTRAFH